MFVIDILVVIVLSVIKFLWFDCVKIIIIVVSIKRCILVIIKIFYKVLIILIVIIVGKLFNFLKVNIFV